MAIFEYDADQWARILAASGVDAGLINRAELTEAAHVFRHQQAQAGSEDAMQAKSKAIRALRQAWEIIRADQIAEPEPYSERENALNYLEASIKSNALHYGISKSNGKRKSTMYRDMFIEIAIIHWCELGHELRTSRRGSDPVGPMVRWVQACVEPAMGVVKGSAVRLVEDKIKAQIADGSGPWFLVERKMAALPISTI